MKKLRKTINMTFLGILFILFLIVVVPILGDIWNYYQASSEFENINIGQEYEKKKEKLWQIKDEILENCEGKSDKEVNKWASENYEDFRIYVDDNCEEIYFFDYGISYGLTFISSSKGYLYESVQDKFDNICECEECLSNGLSFKIYTDMPNCFSGSSAYAVRQNVGDGWYLYQKESY